MKDVDYFYERDLDRTNIKDFYDTLPSHLQSRFKDASKTKIIWGNVLQGYRGPSHFCNNGSGDSATLEAAYGVQEIRYWWGVRKDLNAQIPLIGTIAFVTGRVVQNIQGQMEWTSMYFDDGNGSNVTYSEAQQIQNRNKEAISLNQKGMEALKAGNYEAAANYFDSAYNKCSSGYKSEDTYRENRNHAKAEVLNKDGDMHYTNGDYAEAYSKYDQAYDTCPSSKKDSLNKIKVNREKAKTESDAANLNLQGDQLFDQGKYSEAEAKYQLAMEKSKINNERMKYESNRDKTKFEIGAKNFKLEGDGFFNQGRYGEAETKYQQAFNYSIYNNNKVLYGELSNKAKKEKEAFDLKNLGDIALIACRYSESHNYYQQAYNKASVVTNKTIYEACKYKAEGHKYWQEGWDAENNDNPDEASRKFREAHNMFSRANQLAPDNRDYAVWEEISSLKLEGNDLFNQGSELQEEGNQLKQTHRYEEACSKYREAENKFRQGLRASRDNRFQSCIDIVEDCLRETNEALQNIEMSQLNIQDDAHVDLQHTLSFIQQID